MDSKYNYKQARQKNKELEAWRDKWIARGMLAFLVVVIPWLLLMMVLVAIGVFRWATS